MKQNILYSIVTIFLMSGCNDGMNLLIPAGAHVETSPITADPGTPTPTPDPNATPTPDPSATPNPSGSPTPAPSPTPNPTPGQSGKSRIFVSSAIIAINEDSNTQETFNSICAEEAKCAHLSGKFTALVANNSGIFGNQYSVAGSIYQKAYGAEVPVADSYEALISGKNDAIYANAWQQEIDNSYKNFAWTGQKDFHHASNDDYSCKNWSTDDGYGVVGKIGAGGSDALSVQFQECAVTAHIYCIEHQ